MLQKSGSRRQHLLRGLKQVILYDSDAYSLNLSHMIMLRHGVNRQTIIQVIFLDFDYVGNPLSILDGIFMAIKDDIDCYPHPSKGK